MNAISITAQSKLQLNEIQFKYFLIFWSIIQDIKQRKMIGKVTLGLTPISMG
jgi:hypothetical protein